jgi:DNA invertase Pin-like site-specific DNA recombinase
MLETLQFGDCLILEGFAHLECTMADTCKTTEVLSQRGVHIYDLRAMMQGLHLDPDTSKVLLALFAIHDEIENDLRSERLTESA